MLSESGTPYAMGIAHYIVSLFGTPGGTDPWMIQFGGHHLGLNAVIVGPNVTLAPSLIGTRPARFMRDGQAVRPLRAENDHAFALMNAFDPAQRAKAGTRVLRSFIMMIRSPS
ncbi:DUF3500 domain-containing protein [Roseomonas gilardii]|uniref:DUF3500 domain-containing protein n=1 Tax=Roseomonas gilardii TaxID=257708 RepID=UPI00048860ED|nr:DUF3500 domain-containing protein [Roseomonas gilardii]